MRKLFLIPIIHTQADLGSMSESIRQFYVRKFGKEQWRRHVRTITEIWRRISEKIEQLELDYSKVRLYQDGLPHCGKEAEIVRDLAQTESPNHRLLLELMERGARIEGTESPELLLEEYALARQTLSSLESDRPGPAARRRQELSKRLLERRDRYIAERIDHTLQEGETGLIFLGMLHSLEGLLPTDIEVTRLEHSETQ